MSEDQFQAAADDFVHALEELPDDLGFGRHRPGRSPGTHRGADLSGRVPVVVERADARSLKGGKPVLNTPNASTRPTTTGTGLVIARSWGSRTASDAAVGVVSWGTGTLGPLQPWPSPLPGAASVAVCLRNVLRSVMSDAPYDSRIDREHSQHNHGSCHSPAFGFAARAIVAGRAPAEIRAATTTAGARRATSKRQRDDRRVRGSCFGTHCQRPIPGNVTARPPPARC